jgi:hypothetical protein
MYQWRAIMIQQSVTTPNTFSIQLDRDSRTGDFFGNITYIYGINNMLYSGVKTAEGYNCIGAILLVLFSSIGTIKSLDVYSQAMKVNTFMYEETGSSTLLLHYIHKGEMHYHIYDTSLAWDANHNQLYKDFIDGYDEAARKTKFNHV